MAIPEARVLLLRREYTELNRTHLLKLYQEVPEALANWRAGDQALSFPGNGSLMFFGHCRNDSDFRKHLSTEWDLILVDESGELTPYMLLLLPSRLRTTKPNIRPQYVLGSNPGGEGHDYNHRWYITKEVTPDEDPSYKPEKYFFIQADFHDNPHIDQQEYKERLDALPEWERKRFYGDWSVAPDRAFPTWRPPFHTFLEWPEGDFLYKPWWQLYRSLDWGYAAPTSIGWWIVDELGNCRRIREFYHAELDAEEQVPLIREIDANVYDTIRAHAGHQGIPCEHVEPPRYTVSDPKVWDMAPRWVKGPGPTLAERYRDAGLKDLQPGSNQRIPGWTRLREYLNPKTQPCIYAEAHCTEFIKQMALLRRDEFDEEDVAHVGKKKQNDHAADDSRYFVMSRPRPGFERVPDILEKYAPGSPERHEARHMVKIHAAQSQGHVLNHPTLGPIKLKRIPK